MGARWRSGAVVGAVAAGALAGGLGWQVAGGPGNPGHQGAPTLGRPEPARLVSYADCSQMLAQLRAEAAAEVGPYGLSGSPGVREPDVYAGVAAAGGAGSATAGPAAPSAAPAASAGSPATGTAPSFSTTNDQEQGVDEPDLAKTDGSLMVALRASTDTLEVASVGSSPHLAGSLSLASTVEATCLFLVGHEAVVLGSSVGGSTPATEAVVVDVSDPATPSVSRSFAVQGELVDARLISGLVELVVRSSPQLPFVAPSDPSTAASAAAAAENRAIVLSSGPASWLPSVTSEPSGVTTVAPCAAAMHSAATTSGTAPGLDTVGVVPIDPRSDQPGTEVTVVGDATTVYASATSLYVATSTPAQPVPVPMPAPAAGAPAPAPGATTTAADTTTIDAFDLSDPGAPRYAGSGEVPGSLIGQYALSEYQGDLRVATTVGWATPAPGEGTAPSTPSDSRVTVLARQGDALAPIGSVSGLGSGEKIYAVRFVGPLAYVVTFRQTDPLYVVDLSDPTAPQLAGQLPLTGYSSFLEPVGNGLVLGVGQSVDDNLRTTGLQVSLFDVSDPAHPALVGKDVLSGASSPAQQDPHALLYWAPTGTVVMPVQEYGFEAPGAGSGTGSSFSGAVVWQVTGSGLSEAGRITQPTEAPAAGEVGPSVSGGAVSSMPVCCGGGTFLPAPYGSPIERALVVGDKLYTVSDAGILESDLASLAQGAWVAFS